MSNRFKKVFSALFILVYLLTAPGMLVTPARADSSVTETVENQTAVYGSGHLFKETAGNIDVHDSVYQNNSATGDDGNHYAGTVYINVGKTNNATLTNTSFIGNKATGSDVFSAGIAERSVNELKLDNVKFQDNSAANGYFGAITTSTPSGTGSLTITGGEFTNNSALEVGAVGAFTTTEIKNTTFTGNKATSEAANSDGAGALFLGAEAKTTIDNTIFDANTSGARGGAISTRMAPLGDNAAAKIDITNSTFKNNTAKTEGGALDNSFFNSKNAQGYGYIGNSTFTNNSAANGGAIYNRDKDNANHAVKLKVADSTFEGNKAKIGGAIYNTGTLDIDNVTFTGNTAEKGAAIYNKGDLVVEHSTFKNNEATNEGWASALFVEGTSKKNVTTIKNSTFEGNKATGTGAYGGAVGVRIGTVKIEDTDFIGNTATAGQGAAICTRANVDELSVSIKNGKFENNTAATAGAIGAFTVMDIDGTTFTGNKATDADNDGAGAIYVGSQGIVSIKNAKFNNNESAAAAGAIGTRITNGGKPIPYGDASNHAAKLDIINTEFNGNKAATRGGAFENVFMNSVNAEGYTYVGGSTFTNNSADKGGAIYNQKEDPSRNAVKLKVENTDFTGNTATTNGGAIYNDGTLVFGGVNNFSENKAAGAANDIYNAGTLEFAAGSTTNFTGGIAGTGTTTVKSEATVNFDGATNSAAITNEGTVTAKATTFDGNVTTQNGGLLTATGTNTFNGITEVNGTKSVMDVNADEVTFNNRVRAAQGSTLNINKDKTTGITNMNAKDGDYALVALPTGDYKGAKVNIGGEQLNITGKGGAVGVQAQTNDTAATGDNRTNVVIKAKDTTVNMSDGGAGFVVFSGAQLDIDSNLTVNAEDVLTVRGKSVTNINTNGEHSTVLNGNINYDYEGNTSGSLVDAEVNANMTGTKSVWTGNSLVAWGNMSNSVHESEMMEADLLKVSELNVTLADGGKWTPTEITASDTQAGDTTWNGQRQTKVNSLTMSDGANGIGTIDFVAGTSENATAAIDTLQGTKGVINMGTVTGAKTVVDTFNIKELTVNGGTLESTNSVTNNVAGGNFAFNGTDVNASVVNSQTMTATGTTFCQSVMNSGKMTAGKTTFSAYVQNTDDGTMSVSETTFNSDVTNDGAMSVSETTFSAHVDNNGTLKATDSTLNGVTNTGKMSLTDSTLKEGLVSIGENAVATLNNVTLEDGKKYSAEDSGKIVMESGTLDAKTKTIASYFDEGHEDRGFVLSGSSLLDTNSDQVFTNALTEKGEKTDEYYVAENTYSGAVTAEQIEFNGGNVQLNDKNYTVDYARTAKAALDSRSGGATNLIMMGDLVTAEGDNRTLVNAVDKGQQAAGEVVELDSKTALTLNGSLLVGTNNILTAEGAVAAVEEGTGITVRDTSATSISVNKLDLADKATGLIVTNDKSVTLGGSEGKSQEVDIVEVAEKVVDVDVVVGLDKATAEAIGVAQKGTLNIGNSKADATAQYALAGNVTVNDTETGEEGSSSELNVKGQASISKDLTLSGADVNITDGSSLNVGGTTTVKAAESGQATTIDGTIRGEKLVNDGRLIAKAADLQYQTIENNSIHTLVLGDGALAGNIITTDSDGRGAVVIDGDVSATGKTIKNQDVTVNEAKVLTLNGVTSANTGYANAGTLNLSGDSSTLGNGITGTGVTNVNADTTITGETQIEQSKINIAEGKTLLARRGNLSATDGIEVASTGALKLGTGTVKGNISGEGNTVVKGFSFVDGTVTTDTTVKGGFVAANKIILGNDNKIAGNATGSVAIGNNNSVSGSNTFVLGNNVTTAANNSVVLGNGSTATRDNTVSVGAVGAERQITNVAGGTIGTDAANMNQVWGVEKESHEIGAMSAALAGLHYVEPSGEGDDKFTGAVSYGGYRGESAAAVGLAYKPTTNFMVSAATSIGNSQNLYNAGISYKFGKGNTAASRASLQSQVKYVNEENKKLKDENEQMRETLKSVLERLEKLEKKQ